MGGAWKQERLDRLEKSNVSSGTSSPSPMTHAFTFGFNAFRPPLHKGHLLHASLSSPVLWAADSKLNTSQVRITFLLPPECPQRAPPSTAHRSVRGATHVLEVQEMDKGKLKMWELRHESYTCSCCWSALRHIGMVSSLSLH